MESSRHRCFEGLCAFRSTLTRSISRDQSPIKIGLAASRSTGRWRPDLLGRPAAFHRPARRQHLGASEKTVLVDPFAVDRPQIFNSSNRHIEQHAGHRCRARSSPNISGDRSAAARGGDRSWCRIHCRDHGCGPRRRPGFRREWTSSTRVLRASMMPMIRSGAGGRVRAGGDEGGGELVT